MEIMKIRGVLKLNANRTIKDFDENFGNFITPLIKKGEEITLDLLEKIFSNKKFSFIEQLETGERIEKIVKIDSQGKKEKYIKFIIHPIKPKDIIRGYKISFFDITKEMQLENRIQHLNAVLEAILKINQSAMTDTTKKELLNNVVYHLGNTRGYRAVWIILFNKNMKPVNYNSFGFDKEFNRFIMDIKNGIHYNCLKTSIIESEIKIHRKSKAICGECPLYPTEPNGQVMASPIIYKGSFFGSIFILAPQDFEFIDQEEIYFATLIKNIGLALYNLNLEKKNSAYLKSIKAKDIRYKEFFNNSISANAIIFPDGRIVDCNRAFINLFGYKTKKEALKSNVNDLYLHKNTRSNFIKRIKEEKKVENMTAKYRTITGEIVTVRENSVGIFDKSGRLKRMLIYLQNISKQEELQKQLMQAQKMESLGRVAGGIAHDLNNMLVPIKGYTDMLLLQTPKDSPIYSKLVEIDKASDRATALIKEILAFSKKQILNIETFDLNGEIERFANILKKLIGEKINFNIVLQPKHLNINADKTQIDQILLNLAANARDAMPEGGTLTIETSEINLDTIYTTKHINIKPGKYVLLAFTDTGMGMDDNTINMIFEPFFTTKSNGTGLGLSTVYGIVKQHKGYIVVYSEPGLGTTFKIYFPKSHKRTKINANEKIPMKDFIAGNEKILLVEDEEDVRNVIKEILTQYGYKVYETASSLKALDMVKRGENFDLLITDVVLPELNGKELSNAIKKENKNIKILYMSGYTSNVIAHEKILDEGVNFIHKPFSVTSLLIKVREILESN